MPPMKFILRGAEEAYSVIFIYIPKKTANSSATSFITQ
jgi:hypothetical protein